MDTKRQVVLDAIVEALAVYSTAQTDSHSKHSADAGPAVLAALAAASDHPAAHDNAWIALEAWLSQLDGGTIYPGIFGGLAGFYVGAQTAASLFPRLASLAAVLRDTLAKWSVAGRWRTEAVAWEDYDLISGPAGIVLALATDHACTPEDILPTARHLATLCESERIEGARIGTCQDDERRTWNCGRINTGLAHGVTGIAAALRSALETAEAPNEFAAPLERVCRWLVAESYIDDRGLRTWPPAGLDGKGRPPGVSRRQAWCYGTPGISWTLWDAARVLDDARLRAFAEEAMHSFCAVFDEKLYIDEGSVNDALGICHGVAGTLAVADAFALHARLEDAASLRDYLEAYLLDRIDEVRGLACENMTLLTGASGILAVLLAKQGSQRAWLSHLALR